MKNFIVQHSLILLPILLLTYANIVLKWQVNRMPSIAETAGILDYIWTMAKNGWVITVALAAAFSGVAWSVALKNFDISYAYPFVSLSFLFVTLAGVIFLKEDFSWMAFCGLLFMIIGVSLTARSGV